MPLVLRGPGVPIKRVAAPAETIALFSTLTALAGLPPPPAVAGVAAAPSLFGEETPVFARSFYKRRCDAAAVFESRRHCADGGAWARRVVARCAADGSLSYVGVTLRTARRRYVEFRTANGAPAGSQLYDYRGRDLDAAAAAERRNLVETASPRVLSAWAGRLRGAFPNASGDGIIMF